MSIRQFRVFLCGRMACFKHVEVVLADNKGDQVALLQRQLIRYADDLSSAIQHTAELEKSSEAIKKQLTAYGQDFRKIYDELAVQLEKTKAAYLEIIHRLSLAAEFKDEDTGDHIERISHYSAVMA